jgi:anti-sigma regulatory factor (Ser/Thr protein kinase)
MTGTGRGDDVTVTLRLPPNAAHVRTARLIAAAMARRSGVGEDVLDEVRLAVGEACARAVRVQERQGVITPVTLEFGEAGRFSVSVLDTAKTGSGDEITAVADGRAQRRPGPTPPETSLGLALLGAVVRTSTSTRTATAGHG